MLRLAGFRTAAAAVAGLGQLRGAAALAAEAVPLDALTPIDSDDKNQKSQNDPALDNAETQSEEQARRVRQMELSPTAALKGKGKGKGKGKQRFFWGMGRKGKG